MAEFDHLVIASASLPEGAGWLTDLLGRAPEPGGRHNFMGTHNLLWRLGPRDYLELIAIDPQAVPPARPRWFGLDDFRGPPRLVSWVCRSDLRDPPPGSTVMEAARGDLRWRIAIPDSGVSGCDGLAPLGIDWGTGPHPADRLPDRGLRLAGLHLSHPTPPPIPPGDPRLTASIGPARLSARLTTPHGKVRL